MHEIMLMEVIYQKQKKKQLMSSKPQFDNVNNDSGYYKFGIFYYNKKDTRFMVPKSTNLGYTVNFARPYAYIVLFAVILIIIISILFI